MHRRDLLVASSTGLLLGSAGCLDIPGRGTEPQEGSNDQNEDPVGNGFGPSNDWEVKQFVVSSSADWWDEETDRTGYVELFTSRESALSVLDLDRVDEWRRIEVKSFLEKIHYRWKEHGPGDVLLYIESVGPHAGYDEIEIPELTQNNTVTGTAKAKQTSEGEAEEPTFPSALVQVEGDLSSYDITVIDGWGNEAGVEGSAHGDHHSPIELDWLVSLVDFDHESYEPKRRSGTGSTITDSVELRGGSTHSTSKGIQPVRPWTSCEQIPAKGKLDS